MLPNKERSEISTLSNIRDLKCRLHSHALEWNDQPLQMELLFLLEELDELHGFLDFCGVHKAVTGIPEFNLAWRLRFMRAGLKKCFLKRGQGYK